MDPNDVARLVAELKLTAVVERKVVRVPTTVDGYGQRRIENLVVGRIFDARVVNRDTLRNQIPRIMQLRREAKIKIVGDNLFAINFSSADDRSRAINDGPWNFFRSLMIFKKSVGLQHPTEVLFEDYTTWIQIHNLPINYMTLAVVRSIAEKVGSVLEVETDEGGGCLGQFARARVTRLFDEPLQRYVVAELEDGRDKRMALIRYEKLPDFYMACGRVGHILRHCRDRSVDKAACAFGQWLRAGRVMVTRRPRSEYGRSPEHGRGGISRSSRSTNSMTYDVAVNDYSSKREGDTGAGKAEGGGGGNKEGRIVVYQPGMEDETGLIMDEDVGETKAMEEGETLEGHEAVLDEELDGVGGGDVEVGEEDGVSGTRGDVDVLQAGKEERRMKEGEGVGKLEQIETLEEGGVEAGSHVGLGAKEGCSLLEGTNPSGGAIDSVEKQVAGSGEMSFSSRGRKRWKRQAREVKGSHKLGVSGEMLKEKQQSQTGEQEARRSKLARRMEMELEAGGYATKS